MKLKMEASSDEYYLHNGGGQGGYYCLGRMQGQSGRYPIVLYILIIVFNT